MATDTIQIKNFPAQPQSLYKKPITSAVPAEVIAHSHKAQNTSEDRPGILGSKFLIIAGTLLLFLTAVGLTIMYQQQFAQVQADRLSTPWGRFLIVSGFVLFGIKVSFLLYILYLYLRYKPVTAVTDTELPHCTVIVPAYNEGELVYHTLYSIFQSDFPKDKLQIIAIDDGSKDDTWDWMLKARKELGDSITILQQPVNKGKRHALYRGFNMAQGDVFVTIDSDSIIDKDTLRNLVSPFAVNEQCGAVAGNVKVLNNKKAVIPKMLNVSFAFSFEFIRSAQSTIGSVLCTPGALSAYRREAVLHCLPDWINQTFMGQASDIGEDRAMTNMILKQGYHVNFQKNALVYTNIPEKYKNLYKMFIRWERSNVRENIMMSKFAFSNFREGSKTGTRVLLINQWMNILLSYPLLILMMVVIASYPLMFFTSSVISVVLFSTIQAFFFAKKHNARESVWAYPYSVFYMFALFWITPYAIATAGRRGWLTRDLNS